MKGIYKLRMFIVVHTHFLRQSCTINIINFSLKTIFARICYAYFIRQVISFQKLLQVLTTFDYYQSFSKDNEQPFSYLDYCHRIREGRTRTPYTATYNGAVSYGAKIGSIRVFTEQRASTNRVGLRNFKGAYVASTLRASDLQ